ncbi:MAG TPA: hypothetical protein VF194_16130 [Ferrovibrio sp.]|uniref:FitA-like ribbon-helix-helix domain-containing protein n=1 Tax=Ferrovibrio sp. TaxID=1917215 RepID=UPI002ED3950F
MASITIRNLDDEVKYRLRLSAAINGWSMEDEARTILHAVLADLPLEKVIADGFGPQSGDAAR